VSGRLARYGCRVSAADSRDEVTGERDEPGREGMIAIWNGVTPDLRDEIYDGTIASTCRSGGIAGFRRGRGISRIDSDVDSSRCMNRTPLVHTGGDYTARLNDPTPWTQRMIRGFVDTSRKPVPVAVSHGPGQAVCW